MFLLVGNWRPDPGEKGLSVYEYNSQTGNLKFLNHSENNIAASFLTQGVNKTLVYATHETDSIMDGMPTNQIVTLDISNINEGVKVIARKPSLGPNPTWICSTYNDSHVLITHHGGFCNTSTVACGKDGNFVEKIVYDEPHVILYRLNSDGIPDTVADAMLPSKLDYYPDQMSRSHSVLRAPNKNLYIICDKGLDMVMTVTIDFNNEKIVPLDSVAVPRHNAPRYGVFHRELPVFYADMEGCTDIYAFSYDELGNLKIIQTLNLSCDTAVENTMPSDIILSPDGRKLYVGLRGPNLIAVIDLDTNGVMSIQQLCRNPDGAPNALRFSPDGKYLFVTNVFEKVITKFKVHENGSLDYLGVAAHDLCPASMLFIE